MLHRCYLISLSIRFLSSLLSTLPYLYQDSERRNGGEVLPFSAIPKYKYSTCWVCGSTANGEGIVPPCRCNGLSPQMTLLYCLVGSELGTDIRCVSVPFPKRHPLLESSVYHTQKTSGAEASLQTLAYPLPSGASPYGVL